MQRFQWNRNNRVLLYITLMCRNFGLTTGLTTGLTNSITTGVSSTTYPQSSNKSFIPHPTYDSRNPSMISDQGTATSFQRKSLRDADFNADVSGSSIEDFNHAAEGHQFGATEMKHAGSSTERSPRPVITNALSPSFGAAGRPRAFHAPVTRDFTHADEGASRTRLLAVDYSKRVAVKPLTVNNLAQFHITRNHPFFAEPPRPPPHTVG